MPDVFTKAKRSHVMSLIRSHGNRDTELALIKLFRQYRIVGWRRHQGVFGKPDFVFKRESIAVFTDGCFWHGCPRCYRPPKSKQSFWDAKVRRNRQRDRQVTAKLRKAGWRVVRIWAHELSENPERCVKRVRAILEKSLANGGVKSDNIFYKRE